MTFVYRNAATWSFFTVNCNEKTNVTCRVFHRDPHRDGNNGNPKESVGFAAGMGTDVVGIPQEWNQNLKGSL